MMLGVELVKAQIRLESGGNEKALGGDDGLSDGRASTVERCVV